MSTVVVQIECRCGGRLDYTVTSPHTYLAAREREEFDKAHAACRLPVRGAEQHTTQEGQVSERRPHEVIYDTGVELVCACGGHMWLHGQTRSKAAAFAEHVRDALGRETTPLTTPASSAPATESGQA